MRHGLVLTVIAAVVCVLAAPARANHTLFIKNPLGGAELVNITAPSGATAGTAQFVVTPANGNWANGDGSSDAQRFFGLRIMGSEDVVMRDWSGGDGCEISDFSGRNSDGGWQGAPVVAAGQADRYFRMLGGRLAPGCGSLTINLEFRTTPLVAYYATFWGPNPAPWHDNYGSPVWGPAMGGHQDWWNLWGTFTDMGYSTICVWTGVGAASCQ